MERLGVINRLKPEIHLNSAYTKIQFQPHRKQSVSITETNQLMLFREIIKVKLSQGLIKYHAMKAYEGVED
jgi:hypothetical protein